MRFVRAFKLTLLLTCCAASNALTGCVASPDDIAVLHEPLRVCADDETLDGIDISHHNGAVDWETVADAGISYAFIRVSDGFYLDRRFEENWSNARSAGVLRGAYQFFRPGRDASDQADLLLERMGELEPDDLPPVLDVEDEDGYSASHIQAGIREWMERVESATGRKPIIYTGYYFWRDEVGATAEFNDHPLWLAQYGRTCPTIPDQWASWAFWQTSETGRVAGVSGNVDTDIFNGDLAALLELTGGEVECGDGSCNGGETAETCPGDCPSCPSVPASGAILEESSLCFEAGGSDRYWRSVSDGHDRELLWTYATSNSSPVIYGIWHLDIEEAGTYRLEAYTDGSYADSVEADYEIRHAGQTDEIEVDQTRVDGWTTVGEFEFAAGGDQWVHLGDNTGESGSLRRRLVYDAIRLTPVSPPDDTEPEPEPEPPFDSWTGGPCRNDADCLTGLCFDSDRYGYPEGMCSERCDRYCDDRDGEPTTFCVSVEGEGYCFSRESTAHYSGSGCRSGYHSQSMPRHSQSSVRRDVCLPNMTSDGGTISTPMPEDGDFVPFLPDAVTAEQELVTSVESGCSAVGQGSSPIWLVGLLVGVGMVTWWRRRFKG